MLIRIALALSVFAIPSLACCFAAELIPVYVEKDPVSIVEGYSLGKPAWSGLELYGPSYEYEGKAKYPVVSGPNVAEIGWNDEVIVVKQHYRDSWIFATPDVANPK